MAEKKKILYIVEAMGGGVFTYIVDLANELVNSYDMYIAYAVRKQTPQNYKDYFDKRIHLIEVKNFGRAIDPAKDIAAFFDVKKMAAEIMSGSDYCNIYIFHQFVHFFLLLPLLLAGTELAEDLIDQILTH